MNLVSSRARRGFTLIELLVVIAIIGILSSVVLASLDTARNKGNDAAVKSNLDAARSQAEIIYDSNSNSYGNLCGTANVGGQRSIYSSVLAAANAAGISTVTTTGVTAYSASTNAGTGAVVPTATTANCEYDNTSPGGGTAWAASVPLKTNSALQYCVDSTGVSTTSVIGTGGILLGTANHALSCL